MTTPRMTVGLREALDALARRMIREGNADGGINAEVTALAARSGFPYSLLKANVNHRVSELRRELRLGGTGVSQYE